MTCKEAVRLIPEFLNDNLDEKDLEKFIAHIENCDECREELTIMSLVTEGLSRLEDGSSFNVNDSVRDRIERAQHRIRVHRHLEMTFGILAVTATAAIAAGILIYASVIGF
jgi:predicted anti-sigma-YlaC factor YlaD